MELLDYGGSVVVLNSAQGIKIVLPENAKGRGKDAEIRLFKVSVMPPHIDAFTVKENSHRW